MLIGCNGNLFQKLRYHQLRMGSSYSGGNLHKQSVPTNAKLFGSNDAQHGYK